MTVLVGAAVAVLMEFWAAWMHGTLWHGVLWPTHRSHHPPRALKGQKRPIRWEFNDIFGLAHAMVAAPLIAWGLSPPYGWARDVALGVGGGMTAFGIAYVVVHDGLVHGRLPVGFLNRIVYLRRVAAAHRVHHAKGGAPYGLFLGPWVLRRDAARRKMQTTLRLAQKHSSR